MYSKWEQALSEEARINWKDAVGKMRACGNEPGIYPDVAYLLFRFANHPNVKAVMEFGSGFSTYVLAKTCRKLNDKYVVALESEKIWADKTRCLLSAHGISVGVPDGTVLCAEDMYYPSIFSRGFELVWVDGPIRKGVGRTEACEELRVNIRDAVILFDDAQDDYRGIDPCIGKLGRSLDNAVWFKPTDRLDRHVRISFPCSNHPLLGLVRECELL